jgi:hypothetical protein
MEHGTVGGATATKVVTLLETSKAPAFGHSSDIDVVVHGEDIRQDLIPHVDFSCVRTQSNLPKKPNWVRPSLLEMPFPRPVNTLWRRQLNQPQLGCLISFSPGGLPLHDDARPCLQNSHGPDVSIFSEDLRHTQLFAEYRFNHVRPFSIVRFLSSVVSG